MEDGRDRPYFDANDQATQEQVEVTLARLSLASTRCDAVVTSGRSRRLSLVGCSPETRRWPSKKSATLGIW
ncbi:hypothetical protein [Nocardia farcinica]|uniref:hypothetical protein n=1 Tax=Nocardia farcinica TaxID=37329 RepID=UPI00245688D9|nr:hypothetical protein [Nocardia farcinica]